MHFLYEVFLVGNWAYCLKYMHQENYDISVWSTSGGYLQKTPYCTFGTASVGKLRRFLMYFIKQFMNYWWTNRSWHSLYNASVDVCKSCLTWPLVLPVVLFRKVIGLKMLHPPYKYTIWNYRFTKSVVQSLNLLPIHRYI